jgi:DNA-binding GntR family transcriptional regulator
VFIGAGAALGRGDIAMQTFASTIGTPAPRLPRFDRSRHAAPQIVDYLREQIIGLELAPGAVLSRSDLAARFGLSQTPVRDALMHLAEEGLVEIYAQHKTVVSRIDLQSARQAHFLRLAIEVEVVRTLAAARNAELVRTLRATIARQPIVVHVADYAEFAHTDQLFHRQMYGAAGVPDLWDLLRRQSGHIDRLRRLDLPAPGKAADIVRGHARIVDAIARGDSDLAERRVREHLSGTMSRVASIRASHPEFVIDRASIPESPRPQGGAHVPR